MKKSRQVTLTVVAAVALAGCQRRMDPCESATFDPTACGDAIRNGGYYWRGTWFPMAYHNPYPYYYDSYRRYVYGGGRVTGAPSGAYLRPSTGGTSSTHGSGEVTRGGFGSTGAGHGAGA